MTAAPASGWRDIASAPADVDVLLGWWQLWPDARWKTKVGYARTSNTCSPESGASNGWADGNATHYMPLPEPPK